MWLIEGRAVLMTRHSTRQLAARKALQDYAGMLQHEGLMERRVFWITFTVLDLIAGVSLPLVWAVVATIPIFALSWWIAYRSGWF
jgi:hypothetical protein